MLKWFETGWFDGFGGLEPDHVQSGQMLSAGSALVTRELAVLPPEALLYWCSPRCCCRRRKLAGQIQTGGGTTACPSGPLGSSGRRQQLAELADEGGHQERGQGERSSRHEQRYQNYSYPIIEVHSSISKTLFSCVL